MEGFDPPLPLWKSGARPLRHTRLGWPLLTLYIWSTPLDSAILDAGALSWPCSWLISGRLGPKLILPRPRPSYQALDLFYLEQAVNVIPDSCPLLMININVT